MPTKMDLIERGDTLAAKYSVDELKDALKDALWMEDNCERLAIQWALKKKTKTTDGYAFTKEVTSASKERLET